MPVLVIRRAATGQGGRFRRIRVRAGDRVVAKLRPGAVVTVDLPAGPYELVATMDWFRSAPVTLDLRADAELYTSLPFGQALAGFAEPATAITLRLGPG